MVTRRRISTRCAPAAGSARHRADASRRDRAARSPDPQPASCRRPPRRGFRARAAPSTRHRWCPRPDQQPLSGCVGRDVLAGACAPTPGPAGAVPVRVRSRSSAGLRWTERKALASAKTASAAAHGARLGGSMHGTPVRGTSNVRPWNPVVTAIAGLPPFPRHRERTNVQKGARLSGRRPKVFGAVTRLGWLPKRRRYALACLMSLPKWPTAAATCIRGQQSP